MLKLIFFLTKEKEEQTNQNSPLRFFLFYLIFTLQNKRFCLPFYAITLDFSNIVSKKTNSRRC